MRIAEVDVAPHDRHALVRTTRADTGDPVEGEMPRRQARGEEALRDVRRRLAERVRRSAVNRSAAHEKENRRGNDRGLHGVRTTLVAWRESNRR